MRFCSYCGQKAEYLSMRSLCHKCQRVKGAIQCRMHDCTTGKLRLVVSLPPYQRSN